MGGLELARRVDGDAGGRPAGEGDSAHDDASQNERGLVGPGGSRGQQRTLATAEEVAAFQARFLRLLERRTAIHTMGDSTSVPRHVAADLLRSICFVLGIDPNEPETAEHLLSVDLEDEYRRRLEAIARRVKAAEKLWREVDATMPLVENTALRDTLRSLGGFFTWYDYRSMAHEIPASIDYPLCHPVPEELLGIEYVEEYLRRLMIEARFLACFEVEAIGRVLRRSCADPVEDLVNLYEPVATNAVGLALIGRDPRVLRIAEAERAEITRRLRPLGTAGRERALRGAATRACDKLQLDDPAAEEYLLALAPELLPRIAVGLAHGSLDGVFVG